MRTTTQQWMLAGAVLGIGAFASISGCTSNQTSSNASPAPASVAATNEHTGHEEHTTMNHAMGTTGLEALKKLNGRDFDVAFLSQMIAHHQAAVEMAEQALKTAKDEATRTNAKNVVTAQTREIKQMTDWLKQWYDVTPSAEQQALVKKDMEGMMGMPVTSDKMFYEMMIPHHQGAIDMSELVSERSQRDEVKKLAEQIIRDQKAEIASYHQALGHGGSTEEPAHH